MLSPFPQTPVISFKPTSEQPELCVHIPVIPGAPLKHYQSAIISASSAPVMMSEISWARCYTIFLHL